MLGKTEGAIKNVQSRDTGNIGHTSHRTMTKKKQRNTYTVLVTMETSVDRPNKHLHGVLLAKLSTS